MLSPQPLGSPINRQGLLQIEQGRYSRRQLVNTFAASVMLILTTISILVLLVILFYILVNGISTLFPTVDGQLTFNADFFLKPPDTDLMGNTTGGVAQSIIGTMMVLIVSGLIAVPIGVGVAIYLSEYGRGWFASLVTFVIDLLAGLPSIVIGLFILAAFIGQLSIFKILNYSGIAGALALVVIIVPIVSRSVEQILKLVPDSLREAGLALGLPRWRVIVRIVLPTVAGGIATGIMLALARAAGETAPILLTMLGNEFITTDLNEPMDALPLRIFKNATTGRPDLVPRAWAGALVLVLVIGLLSVAVRYVTGRTRYDS